MKTAKYLPVALLGVAIVAGGTAVSYAQTAPQRVEAETPAEPAQFRGDREKRGKFWRASHRGGGRMGGGMFRDLFDTVDADGDRSVTRAEIDAYRTTKLAEVDASGDGALSIEEFDTLYRELTRSRMVDAFQRFDVDGDGAIAPAEIDRNIDRLVERMDRDGDGALTLQRQGRGDREQE